MPDSLQFENDDEAIRACCAEKDKRDRLVHDARTVTTRANGWLVTLEAGKGYYQHHYADEWGEALDCYQDPPMGYQAVAISACIDGVPFADLSATTIGEMRHETQRDMA